MLIQDILKKSKEEDPEAVAIYTTDSYLTYEQLYNESVRLHLQLIQRKIERRKRIGIFFNNSPDFIIVFFAILMSDCIAVPLPYNGNCNEIIRLINICDIDIVLSKNTEEISDHNWIITSRLNQDVVFGDGNSEYEEASTDPNEVAVLLATSGTTSDPKVIQLSHRNIFTNSHAHANAIKLDKRDIFAVTMPLHFSSTLTTQLLSCIISRTTLALFELPLLPKKLIHHLNTIPVTCFACVPTTLKMLVNESQKKNITLSNTIHTIVVSGAALEEEVYKLAQLVFPRAKILQTYGLSEASPRVSIMSRDDISLSCGKAVEGVSIFVVRENGQRCNYNEVGQIVVSGDNIMMGYYKNDEDTKKVIKDGELYTGDLGYLDEQERLFIVGRIKNIINVGGSNVYPEEIEQLLRNHPEISDVIVIGEEDTLLGEIPVAYVRLINNSTKISGIELKQYLSNLLAPYKIPKHFYSVDEIQKTSTGKLIRRSIREKRQL
ncbi:class I adenylate-forming enzyme family protein [Paenibacillus xylaniclasticus]|uniref:class I adenylate-forming enzyme family protein n=1 Tax=Paenibacillus xylaniclasticus TaxID=588083 RepID=UPI000FDC4D16|nr:class I adenylate-forming enzyme family protein [Paenibacillus xylaniclasticus]